MHGLGFSSCPSGEHFLSLFRGGLWQWTQRQDGMSYLFLHTAGSWCSCIQSQDFPYPALAVRYAVITVVILAFPSREVLNSRKVVAKFWGRKAGFSRGWRRMAIYLGHLSDLLTQAKILPIAFDNFPLTKHFLEDPVLHSKCSVTL